MEAIGTAPDQPARILNVNDHDASRYWVGRILEQAGFAVMEASTGEEALRLVESFRPDLVVLDVKLPDTSGFEVCRRVKADRQEGGPLVLLTSATFTESESRVEGLEGGADGFLASPFEAQELIATVRSLLRLTRAEAELRRRAAELAEADRRKDAFLAMLAHELRNPLAAIRAALPLLDLRRCDDTRGPALLEILRRQSAQLARIVDDLLDVARITRGTFELSRARVDLRAVVEEAVEAMRPRADARRLAVTARLGDAPAPVDGDHSRLLQVLGNLLDNAAKYTDPGGSVTVVLDVGPGEAVVRVRDTGAGIAPAHLPRIFDSFVQGEQGLDRKNGGLGLGLTLVRELVRLHGGDVAARSEGPGQGSEFEMRLPLAACAAADGRPLDGPAGGDRGPGIRVLVVEDNPDVRETLAGLLRDLGHDVRLAADGEQGIELITAFRPDVALVDVGLPGLDGYALARLVRARLGRRVGLVALTGYGGEASRRRALEAGFDRHLVKPIEPADLARLVLEMRPAPDAA